MTSIGDRLLGLSLLILALAYGWGAQQWPEPFGGSETVGPETFPTLLAIILALASLNMMFKPDPDADWPPRKTLIELAMAILALFIYALLIEPVGFILTTLACVAFLAWRMGAALKPALMIATVGAVVVYLLFNNLLDLPLPLGLLEFN
ncbi:MAG: tripartite tricarboxylate transporter TctB family protein [Reinekea forsetii]|jgi:putative tricarboxylic transport membrane protein|uniref:tripartite tricarboxylate transporter TctB family protein n=1 Tax=Reinekea TaxID=230494 RepID=UPI002355980C|nr:MULTISPECIES: tripartite tricarboxylate transporter TctB family protein [Reinekea]MDO7644931.1 tripartite tricarboxylate transporter TctB family protein [Reinekea forsetii]MDO7675002.1 tripartite tricarboxylate transporter TctB family protein [Reinekea forsetii]|tara:strand:+ start:387 stop:833 length:447 start_codon:yes stop_codon:yes gene_type:complete